MDQDVIIYVHNLGIIKYIIHHVGMNRIHIISGIAIAMIALLLVTTTTMSGQQSAFAHRSRHHGGGTASHSCRRLKVLQQPQQLVVPQPQLQRLKVLQQQRRAAAS